MAASVTVAQRNVQPKQPRLKVLPRLQAVNGVAVTVSIQLHLSMTSQLRAIVSNSAPTRTLPTMLKRLPGNISVSTQSIMLQPNALSSGISAAAGPSASTSTTSINLIPNHLVIVQPINMKLSRAKLHTEPQTSLKNHQPDW